MDTRPREAQKPVNREQVRMLVTAVGYQEASKQLSIKEATLRKWAERGQWNKPRSVPHPKAVTVVTNPADALAKTLQERKDNSKLHLSKYVENASLEASTLEGKASLKASKAVKDVAGIHQVIWPEKNNQEQGILGGLQVYSEQTVIQVNTPAEPAE